jgi:hypothetical protein
VVFCGECGAAITAPPGAVAGDRVARVPPAPQGSPKGKSGEPRSSRPSELEQRRTVMGMPAVVAADPGKVGKRDAPAGGRKSRKFSVHIPAATEDTDRMLEALEAGFDSISRPSETPVIPITPSVVPDLPPALERASVAEGAPAEAAPAQAAPAEAAPAEAAPAEASAPAEAAPAEASAPAEAEPELDFTAPPRDDAALLAQHESDMAQVRSLFTEMAVAHARPLRDFMIEVTWGDATREWLDVALPASTALRRAADALEMPELGTALDGFTAALELAAGEAAITGDAKELVLSAYARLIELMPAAFALDGERGRREPIIVRSLLLAVPGVHQLALDKIYAAGLVSLEMLYAAGPRELAETTGLDREVCARIHDRLQRYRREVAALDPGKDRAAERIELGAALAGLTQAHEEHERLARAWSSDAAAGRVRARKDRNDALLQINVLLARMGEVDRLQALEKVSFAQKIRDLNAFLDEAKRRASRP